ncbi:MAG: histidine--tRNA ligase [Gammaproteobacteria bacterium]|nr:histidine--tRNA ligase [Gammaproteobacteria bacterium]
MDKTLQPVRGMNDVLAEQMPWWQFLEAEARALFAAYGYQEVRLPLLEPTELFKRSIGEFTDIVEKEMYTFTDRGGDSLTLRPEATAGLVRAAISNGLLHNQKHRLWTSGPMFRYERPQKGRFRQFHQIDIEAFGYDGPDIDAEMILMSARLWGRLGIRRVKLQVNSLGTPESRKDYRELLVRYFEQHRAVLDEDSLRRLGGNPLRILDSKNPAMQDMIAGAPMITDHLDPESKAHFDGLCAHLSACGIEFTVNPRLVRGLDYYTRTVFEWTTDALGSQDAVCSGGRYDRLIAQLGGEPTPAIGWALGEERIVGLLQDAGVAVPSGAPGVFLVLAGEPAMRVGLKLAEDLREALPGIGVQANLGGGGIKAQMKRADKSGAAIAVIVGDAEVERGTAAIKSLRAEAPQQECSWAELPARIRALT